VSKGVRKKSVLSLIDLLNWQGERVKIEESGSTHCKAKSIIGFSVVSKAESSSGNKSSGKVGLEQWSSV
jgi:hypothetical protein